MGRRTRFGTIIAVTLALATYPAVADAAVSVIWERNWGSTGLENGQVQFPPDVATDKWGNVYVAGGENGDHRVQMFDGSGVFLKSIGSTMTPSPGPLYSPRCVATDRWGTIYVGDKSSESASTSAIWMFNPRLYSILGTFQETAANEISNPLNLAVSLDGDVVSSDDGTTLQVWRHRGLSRSWTALGTPSVGLAVTQDGTVLTTTDISAGTTNSVVTYDLWGTYQDSWGGLGTADGQFRRPYDVGADPLGNVYVVESQGARGQVFAPDGTHLTTFGSWGAGDMQFESPYGIAVGLDRTLYVADSDNDRISKWKVTVPTESTQVAGADRISTAVEASKRAYPDGAMTVVLATSTNWPDALGGAALAGVAKAPLLLVPKDSLPAAVATEITRLGAQHVYVLGGPGVVSDSVFSAARGLVLGGSGARLGGDNRYETANTIAAEVVRLKDLTGGYDGTAFVCTGSNFPDALSAAPIAAANGWPVYLSEPGSLSVATRAAMIDNASNHGYIVGGLGALSAAVDAQLDASPFVGFTRYAGGNRYQTSALLAQRGFEGMGMLWSRPALATGENFPDALAGGVLQGSDCSVLLLTPTASLDASAAAAIAANKDSIYEIRFLGGSGAVSTQVRTSARALLW
ncbi:MAG: cell wall-binding repeat-containing protein [Coriobacteriales bacterium]|nr:cell wall-binding repeat-containing protein [Actinomycetes bacterium]